MIMEIFTTLAKNYSSEYAKLAGKFLLSGEIFQLYSIIFLFSPTYFLAASKTSFAMSRGFAFFLGGPSVICPLYSDPPT